MAGFGALNQAPGTAPIGWGAQLAQAGQEFPAQQQQVKDQKFQNDERKLAISSQEAAMEEAQQKQSLSKLGFLYKMVQSDPSGQRTRDPAFVKSVNDAAKTAGLPPMSHVDPMTGMEVLDANALKILAGGGKTYDTLNEGEQKMVGVALPGAARAAMYQRLGVDPSSVPADVLNAPPDTSFKGREEVIKDFTSQLANIPKGTQTVEGINSVLRTMQGELSASGVSISDMKDMITSPAFAEQVLAPQIAAKATSMQRMGLKDDAIRKWYDERTKQMPAELASKVKIANGRLELEKDKVNTQRDQGRERLQQAADRLNNDRRRTDVYIRQVDTSISKASKGADLAQASLVAKLADEQLKPLEKQRDNLIRLEQTYMTAQGNNFRGFPDDMAKQLEDLNTTINDGRGKITTLQAAVEAGKGNRLSSVTNKEVRVAPAPGSIDVSNPAQARLQYDYNIRTGQYRNTSGDIFDAQGHPVAKPDAQ